MSVKERVQGHFGKRMTMTRGHWYLQYLLYGLPTALLFAIVPLYLQKADEAELERARIERVEKIIERNAVEAMARRVAQEEIAKRFPGAAVEIK